MIDQSRLNMLIVTIALAGCASHAQSSGSQAESTSGSNASTQPSGASSESPSPAPAEASATPEASASPAPNATASASPEPVNLPPMPTGLHGPSTPWERMNAHQRGEYMSHSVLPAMQALFSAYDSSAYAHVTCETCHGTNAREVHFRMPNRLPTLPMFGTEASQRHMAEHQRMYAFMHERVVPSMSQLLGMHPFDPQTRQGFGCMACHHIEGMH